MNAGESGGASALRASMPRVRVRRLVQCALCAATALVGLGCLGSESAPSPPRARVDLRVTPLSLPGIGAACYDVRVTNASDGAGDVVWARGDVTRPWHDTDPETPDDMGTLCSTEFGNGPGGDLAYVGTCDAGSNGAGPGGASQQTNSVVVWIDGLYDHQDPPEPIAASGQDWRNPCAYDEAAPHQGGCLFEVLCVENADADVVVNLTILRDAQQGFFDVGVTFEDIFCSAKVDCSRLTPDGEAPLDLLVSPTGGARLPSVVLGFACTSGPATDTHLYVSAALDCNGTVLSLPLGGPAGNVYEEGALGPAPIVQLATYRGVEALANPDATPLDKLFFNTALALDFAHLPGACRLTGTLTASEGPFAYPFTSPSDTIYPYVRVDVPLVLSADATGYACLRDPLGAVPADGVWTRYTSAGGTVRFDYEGHAVGGSIVVESRLDPNPPPHFTHAPYLDPSSVERISRFRSGLGHDFSDSFESCRSMKHYFCMTGCRGGTLDWPSIEIRSPVDGTISVMEVELGLGTQVRIVPDGYPDWNVRIFHVNPESGLTVGTHVSAGQLLGHHVSNDTWSDIGVEQFVEGGFRRVSWFDTMDDTLFQAYADRGATRDALMITKSERDALPLTCDGEHFETPGPLENWVDLTPL